MFVCVCAHKLNTLTLSFKIKVFMVDFVIHTGDLSCYQSIKDP